jgi:hypothetical protein
MNYHLQKPSAISTYMDRLVTWCQSGFVLVRITKLHGRNCNEVWDRSFTSTAPACGCYLKQASVLADIFLMWSLHPFSFQFSFDYWNESWFVLSSVLADIFLMWSLHPISFQFSFDYWNESWFVQNTVPTFYDNCKLDRRIILKNFLEYLPTK